MQVLNSFNRLQNFIIFFIILFVIRNRNSESNNGQSKPIILTNLPVRKYF